MLPKEFYQHDREWLIETIKHLPVALQIVACKGYSTAYLEALDKEPSVHKKENAARFAANSRLRNYIKNVTCNRN